MGGLVHLLLFAQKLKVNEAFWQKPIAGVKICACGFVYSFNHRRVFFACICEGGILTQVSTTRYFLACFKCED